MISICSLTLFFFLLILLIHGIAIFSEDLFFTKLKQETVFLDDQRISWLHQLMV